MKIRNTVRGLALVGATAALLPLGSAVAAGPGFDSMTVTGTGKIDGCPVAAGGNCLQLISEDGFLQQEVTTPEGVFIQTVILDAFAESVGTVGVAVSTLSFSDMTFINMSGNDKGIKGLQRIVDDPADGTGDHFASTTQLLIGDWAITQAEKDAPNGLTNLSIVQTFIDSSATGTAEGAPASFIDDEGNTIPSSANKIEDDFVSTFSLAVNLNSDGEQTGSSMDIDQDVGLADVEATDVVKDFQRFALRQRSGDQQLAAGSIELGESFIGNSGGNVGSGGGGGGTLDWASGDDLMVTWIGQNVSLDNVGSGVFGFQSVENRSRPANDSSRKISTFSTSTAAFTPTTPFEWDSLGDGFGAAPILPVEVVPDP